MSYLKIMFWLFKRKKVADKKAITPCVCDNGGDPLQDSLTLQEFGSPTPAPAAPPKQGVGVGERRGYRRLEPNVSSSRPDSSGSECGSSSSSSGEEEEEEERGNEYFEGFTDTDDEEEELTCNLCERSFRTVRRLERHQQRQRHYMCGVCDAVFDGLMLLEAHKETLDHWSDYELRVKKSYGENGGEDEDEEDEEDEPEEHRVFRGRGDELRRLLL